MNDPRPASTSTTTPDELPVEQAGFAGTITNPFVVEASGIAASRGTPVCSGFTTTAATPPRPAPFVQRALLHPGPLWCHSVTYVCPDPSMPMTSAAPRE